MKIKNLDTTKVYDLSDLNKKQRKALYDWLVKNDLNWENIFKRDFIIIYEDFLIYNGVEWDWVTEAHIDKKQVITNALKLFYEEKEDFVYNGNPNIMDIEVRYIEVKPSVFINNHYEDITINIKVTANQKVIISYEQL